jgi:hypothetical protein
LAIFASRSSSLSPFRAEMGKMHSVTHYWDLAGIFEKGIKDSSRQAAYTWRNQSQSGVCDMRSKGNGFQ